MKEVGCAIKKREKYTIMSSNESLCPINMPSVIISMLYKMAEIALQAPIIHIYWHPKHKNMYSLSAEDSACFH